MQPEFGLKREQQNQLVFAEGKNPHSPFHFHSQIELYFIEEGAVEVCVNDRRQILKPGEISVAFSYDAHGYQTVTDSKVRYLIIPMDLCGEFAPMLRSKQSCDPFIRDRRIFDRLIACYDGIKTSQSKIKTVGYIYVILGTLLEEMHFEEIPAPADPRLSAQLLFYIHENFKGDLSLRSLSAALGYHPSYLSRYFKECFHIGINQYITMVRLREAILLLKEHKANITCCAYESGFNSVRTFYRAFYNEFHCSPTEYLSRES